MAECGREPAASATGGERSQRLQDAWTSPRGQLYVMIRRIIIYTTLWMINPSAMKPSIAEADPGRPSMNAAGNSLHRLRYSVIIVRANEYIVSLFTDENRVRTYGGESVTVQHVPLRQNKTLEDTREHLPFNMGHPPDVDRRVRIIYTWGLLDSKDETTTIRQNLVRGRCDLEFPISW